MNLEEWVNADGQKIKFGEILKYIKNVSKNNTDLEISIGTDSKIKDKNSILFVTALCIKAEGPKIRRFFLFKERIPASKSEMNVFMKLQNEAIRSTNAAEYFLEKAPSFNKEQIIIHLDCNKYNNASKAMSSRYAQVYTSYTQSLGYNFVLKPDSWAAFSVADKFTK